MCPTYQCTNTNDGLVISSADPAFTAKEWQERLVDFVDPLFHREGRPGRHDFVGRVTRSAPSVLRPFPSLLCVHHPVGGGGLTNNNRHLHFTLMDMVADTMARSLALP